MVNIPELKRGIANDMTEAIGNTPLVRLNRLTEGLEADVLVKVESFNPVSSIKDRIAVNLIETAEKEGLLKEVPLHHPKATKIDYADVLSFKEEYLYIITY